jgi:hypothetical protein
LAERAQLLYWTYLAAALSRSRPAGEQLNRIVTELKEIGLARRQDHLVFEHPHHRRLSRHHRG